jgi:CDP-glucose 4,6-dehydratase
MVSRIDRTFRTRKIFITGHTGFKGSWLSLWLHSMGAEVTGYSLAPPTEPNLFQICRIDDLINSRTGDIRDLNSLQKALQESSPEIVIHLAAQAIVRESYSNPVETFSTNIMGTVNLLEAVRLVPGIKAVVIVTTDKCYENREWVWGYREDDILGGFDPYSSSKACAELVSSAYRRSFFQSVPNSNPAAAKNIATARAGNVLGGGDWGRDRLIPDCIRALAAGEKIIIRNPSAVRPWQHVLEPLGGYLLLASRLAGGGASYSEAWNFGPDDESARPVNWILDYVAGKVPGFGWKLDDSANPHEANFLKLDSTKARSRLGWRPRWGIEKALDRTIEWYKAWLNGGSMRDFTLEQIKEYERSERVEPHGK